jgi:hypothetical protein
MLHQRAIRSDLRFSGEAGIRTLGRASTTPVFETGPFGHSGTSPDNATATATDAA